jgi:hypothetical protein
MERGRAGKAGMLGRDGANPTNDAATVIIRGQNPQWTLDSSFMIICLIINSPVRRSDLPGRGEEAAEMFDSARISAASLELGPVPPPVCLESGLL